MAKHRKSHFLVFKIFTAPPPPLIENDASQVHIQCNPQSVKLQYSSTTPHTYRQEELGRNSNAPTPDHVQSYLFLLPADLGGPKPVNQGNKGAMIFLFGNNSLTDDSES